MVNYQNGKIYLLRSSQTTDVYIGSTTKNYLSQRIAQHKSAYKRYLNKTYGYMTSFELIKYDDVAIELIETFPCNSSDELHAREGHHIRNIQCINKIIPGRTPKEYREENSESIKEKFTCECGGKYTWQHKARHMNSEKHKKFELTLTTVNLQ